MLSLKLFKFPRLIMSILLLRGSSSQAGLGNCQGEFAPCVHNHWPKNGLSMLACVLPTHPSNESSRIKAEVGHGSFFHMNLIGIDLCLTFTIRLRLA
jgi:hypothetical protein